MLSIIAAHTCVFWTIAIVMSTYYGVRGVVIEMRATGDGVWPPGWQKVFVHYAHTFILNTFGSFAGFVALLLASHVYEQLSPPRQLETGTAILLGFLALVAITGMTGILPEMLYRGRLFGSGSK